MDALALLCDPAYLAAAMLGWLLGTTARTAHHLGRHHP